MNFLETNSTSNIILSITAVIIFFYTLVTYLLFRENKKQTEYYYKRPFFRLQWTTNNSDKNKCSLQLVNNGRGVAKNIIIKPIKVDGKVIRLKNVTASSAELGNTILKYVNPQEDIFDSESYDKYFEIEIEYENIDAEKYEAKFSLNSEYNDGFKIDYQRKIK